MKSGTSSLNPYATSYVPISKRKVGEHTQARGAPVSKAWQSYNHYGPEHAAESRQHNDQGFYGSSLRSPDDKIDKQMTEEGFDMDLEFLRMSFPDVSSESLVDVYAANNGDLENTFDMLNQLEFDNPTSLPDTLEIGDVPESESESSLKLKNVVGEGSSGTSSSSSASATVAS